MKNVIGSLFVFFFLIFGLMGVCQEVPRIKSYGIEDYNATLQNWDIEQDSLGFIYVANSEGVLIFNGLKWQKMLLDKNRLPRSLGIGIDGRVYVGGYEMFGYIDMSNRTHPRYFALGDSLLRGSGQEIWAIYQSKKMMVLQSFADLYTYDYQKVTHFRPPSNIMLGINTPNDVIVPKISEGLYRFDGLKFEELKYVGKFEKQVRIKSLVNMAELNQLLIGTENHGLYLLKDTPKESVLTILNTSLNEKLKIEQINKIIRLSNGDYVIGTILNGLYFLDSNFNLRYRINKSNGLSNNTVLALYEVQNGDVWVALDKGINVIRYKDKKLYYYDTQGSLGTFFTAKSHKGKTYFGTNQGVYLKDDIGRLTLINGSQGQVWTFGKLGEELFCGHNNGVYVIRNGSFIQISGITGCLSMQAIDQDKLILSTYSGLILLTKSEDGYIRKVINGGGRLFDKFLIVENYMIGYHLNSGLSVVKLSGDLSKVDSIVNFSNLNGVSFNNTLELFYSNNNLYVCQDNRFFKWSRSPNGFKLEKDNLFHEVAVSSIPNIKNSTKLPRINDGGRHSLISDSIVITGFEGGYNITNLMTMDKSEFVNSQLLDKINIDYILVNDIEKTYQNKLVLNPEENDLTIQLKSRTSNINPDSVYFRLFPWDRKWYKMPKNGTIPFVNLDNGTYSLFLRDEQGHEKKYASFEIKPHWYESYLGFSIYFSALTLFSFGLYRRGKKRIAQKLAIITHEKEVEIENERIKSKLKAMEQDIMFKSKLLSNSTMTIVQKNKMLNELKEMLVNSDPSKQKSIFPKHKFLHLIEKNINSDHDWEIFEENFAAVHHDFLQSLQQKFPEITTGDLRLAAYIKMDLSSKEIAPLFNISVRSVENKRYRLRVKLSVDSDTSLSDFLMRI
jgi:hypothetical protein